MIVIDMFCHLERDPTLSQYQYLASIIASLIPVLIQNNDHVAFFNSFQCCAGLDQDLQF